METPRYSNYVNTSEQFRLFAYRFTEKLRGCTNEDDRVYCTHCLINLNDGKEPLESSPELTWSTEEIDTVRFQVMSKNLTLRVAWQPGHEARQAELNPLSEPMVSLKRSVHSDSGSEAQIDAVSGTQAKRARLNPCHNRAEQASNPSSGATIASSHPDPERSAHQLEMSDQAVSHTAGVSNAPIVRLAPWAARAASSQDAQGTATSHAGSTTLPSSAKSAAPQPHMKAPAMSHEAACTGAAPMGLSSRDERSGLQPPAQEPVASHESTQNAAASSRLDIPCHTQ